MFRTFRENIRIRRKERLEKDIYSIELLYEWLDSLTKVSDSFYES